ncbi:MAG: T9SS type A sorting domain-containing protein [Bacteroidetes bacterium]|nr:MAG: T9SS type A sorting domain-containing protein [Bacteroidota bacterium]
MNFIRLSLIGFLLSDVCQLLYSQVVINELSSANDAVVADEDGDYEDWIELYNPTNVTISLNKYSFLYEVPNEAPVSWTFPKIFIKPRQHLLIFASKKNRKEAIDHWEVPIFADSTWRYKVNTASGPAANWYQPTYSDISWLQGKGGFGYADGDDQTNTGAAYSVFLRKNFSVTDTSKYSLGVLMIDYDDAFVAFLNGVEVARSNIGAFGDHPVYNVSAYDEHEAKLYQGGSQEFFFVQLKNSLKPGNNVFSIQAHNYSGGMDDLTVMPWLILGSKDTAQQFISFPAEFRMHTNFSLSSTEGFKLTLKDSLGAIKDSLTLGPKNMQANNSKGRNPDGSVSWCLFWGPSPADTNDVTQCFGTYSAKPAFNLPAGFYTGVQTLSITVPAGTAVFYTRNGNNPMWTDSMYTGSIIIDSTQVIRARAFALSGTDLPSSTITNSYFINENSTLPVISLCTDSVNLWDWNTGIYVMGPNADTVNLPNQNANFWMPWKKQAHTEFFTKNKLLGFEQDCATEIHGNFSRAWPQKSFRIMANDDYQDPYINYKLFPEKNITKFKSFNIRNAGIDWNTCHFRDRLMHDIVQKKTDIDIMDGEACLLFLNGQYWGVYEMRERQDENYIAGNHNVSPDSIDLLRFEGDILEGSNAAFYGMVGFLANNNMAIQANYDSAQKLIDIENYSDYFITETYYNNWDWFWTDLANNTQGTNNIKFWRGTNPVTKWRYVLWDTDLGMALMDGAAVNCPQNLFGTITDPVITSPSLHIVMLKAMLQNTSFKNYFVNRYCDLMNTVFHPDSVLAKVNNVRTELQPEMARQFARWNGGPITIFGAWDVGRSIDIPTWLNEIDTLEEFVNCRPYNVRDSLQAEFALTKQVDVTLDVSPAGAGKIHLNTIDPVPYPWTGIYMDGVPITMTAIPNTGYVFSHWQAPILIPTPVSTASVSLNVTVNETFTAYFTPIPPGVDPLEASLGLGVYPNPFTDDFSVTYTLHQDEKISVRLFDILGQEVIQLVAADQPQNAGAHELKVNSADYELSGGIYFLKFTTEGFSKMIRLVKTGN